MQIWTKINVMTLHKVVETMQYGGNVHRSQSYRRSNEILDCDFFWPGSVYIFFTNSDDSAPVEFADQINGNCRQ